jgi:outer membrane biosynthesis protein TonB
MRNVMGVVCALSLCGCATSSGEQKMEPSGPTQAATPEGTAVNPERQDAIERTFARKTGELQDCWSKEYEKLHDKKVEGDLTIQMDVQPNGSPANVKILKSTINNHDIEGCVTQAIGQWSFPDGDATIPYLRTVHLGAQF